MAEQNWERRILQSFGSNFRLDVANPQKTVGGEDLYNFYSVTDEEKVCLMGQQQDGIWRLYNDEKVEIVGGAKVVEDGVCVTIVGKNGDVVINADNNGRVRIRGQNIIIQADEDVSISAGRNVNIKSGSGRVLLAGNTLEKDGLKGNLLDPEKQWARRVFEGTGMPASALSGLLPSFGGITDLAGSILTGGFGNAIGNVVGGAIDSAVGGALGGVAGGALGGITGGLGGIAGDAIGGLTGGLTDGLAGGVGGLTDGLGSIAGDAIGGISGGLGGIAGDAIGGIVGGDVGGIAGDLVGGIISDSAGNIAGGAGGLSGGSASDGANAIGIDAGGGGTGSDRGEDIDFVEE
jgi:hypothetical protein